MKHSFPRYALFAAALWISIAAIGRAISPDIVISQVYGGGGNTGAIYTHDYIELFNRGASTVSLTGWSVQYTSATGTGNFGSSTSLITPLAGSLAPGQYLLVQEASNAAVGSPLPTPDVTDATPINMAAAGGKVALVNTTTPLGCNGGSTPCSAGALATIVDLIGWDGANFFEGTVGPTTSNTTAAIRAAGGCTDTDNNGADFTAGTPNPRNTASPFNVCSGPGAPTNPTGIAAANPNIVEPADTTLLTVAVTPGTNPVSTGISVVGNLSAIGGSSTQAFLDDGLSGDAVAGDGIFSYQVTVLFSTTAGKKTLPITVSDAQARSSSTSIGLAVVSADLAIHDVQGSGTSSPHTGEFVGTRGIVIGVKSNGFFIQTPDADSDADANTSEGVFVFTSSAPPAAAAVGNAVRVAATVQEFIPSADPNSPPVTELGGSPVVSVVSTGNPPPTATALTAADTDPSGSIEQLEKYEGMRVSVASLTVIHGTEGSISEVNATSTSNGVFYGVITGVARPFREPGIETPDPFPAGSPCCIPTFDANPERLRVDSDGQVGSTALEVTTGATVTGLVGPLDYAFRTYTILPDTPPGVSGNISAIPVPARAADEFTVASFNLERFFDDVDDPTINEPVLTSAAFANRVNKASLAIRNVLKAPDILGVVEVEKLTTLQALATKLNSDDPSLDYVGYLVEGNDIGGIDVGFLVNDNRANVVSVTQEGKNTTYINPNDGMPELLNDRPPLVLRASITPSVGVTFPVTVIVNHLRSLNGVDDPIDGNRVRTKRRAQAEFLANLIQTHETAGERVISVGDYNAFQFNDGYVDSIGTVKGTPTPADQVVLASNDLVTPDLTDLVDTAPAAERYSYVFDGSAQVLDHILVSLDPLGRLRDFATARLDSDFPESFRNDPNRPERISDHDAPVAFFTLDPDGDGVFDDADACTASSSSVTVVIDGCDSGAGNDLLSDGCKITDRIAACAAAASTHDDFTGCVTRLLNDLKRDGFITNKEKGDIQKCAARAGIP